MNQEKIDKEKIILLIKLAQQTQRYYQMADYSQKLLICQGELLPKERNLCFVAFKYIVKKRKDQLKILDALEINQQYNRMNNEITQYKENIRIQLKTFCDNILNIINNCILNSREKLSNQAILFYTKMKADCYRYLIQSQKSQNKKSLYKTKAYQQYSQALMLSQSLSSTNPICISLNLNRSIFFYDIMNDKQKGLKIAKAAIKRLCEKNDNFNAEYAEENRQLLQLLKDNVQLWAQT